MQINQYNIIDSHKSNRQKFARAFDNLLISEVSTVIQNTKKIINLTNVNVVKFVHV